MTLEEPDHTFKDLPRLLTFRGSASCCQLAGLPDIVMVRFNDRDIELLLEACQDGLDLASLAFQRMTARQVDREGQYADTHGLNLTRQWVKVKQVRSGEVFLDDHWVGQGAQALNGDGNNVAIQQVTHACRCTGQDQVAGFEGHNG